MCAAYDFLRELYPEGLPPYHLLIWTVEGEKKISHWFPTIESAASFASTTAADAVYFGVGLARMDLGPHRRCRSQEVAAVPGVVCDIDVYCARVHEKPGLPPSIDEALRILPERFQPTLVWDTGHGIQAVWLCKERWDLDSQDERDRAAALSQRWHTYLAGEAKRLGYTIDAVHDLARVLRLPGSTNNKVPGDPRPVHVIRNTGQRYNPSDLESVLDTFGVPEIEIKSTDERGHVEYGDLRLDPRVQLPPETQEKLELLLKNISEFARVWNREKRMPKDKSWSGYAQSIANTLAYVDAMAADEPADARSSPPMCFSDQEIIDILTKHRREHGDPGKQNPKPLAWYVKYTIPKARKWATEQRERDRTREEQEAKKKQAAEQEATEHRNVVAIQTGDQDAARGFLDEVLNLPVQRIVQVGMDTDPAYKIVLKCGSGERVIEIPSLAAMNSFVALDRYVWRYTGAPLPPNAKKRWREVRTAFGKLIEVEDTGVGTVELMITDLGEYFATASDSLFEKYPVDEFPNGPLPSGGSFTGWHGCLVRATSDAEYRVALSLMALRQRDRHSVPGVYFVESNGEASLEGRGSDAGATARVVFRGPHFFDWLRKYKERKFEIDEMNHRLVDAGFRYTDTGIEAGVRLRRVWRGPLADAAVDEHQFLRPDDLADLEAKEREMRRMVQ